MTERSYMWGGTTTGDATLAPYDDDEFSDFLATLFHYDRTLEAIVPYPTSNLVVTNPSGTTIRVASGKALVDGKLYTSDANVNFAVSVPGSGTNYYRVVLRKSWSSQTVRLALIGPNTSTYPSVTQSDGTTWEVAIARVSVSSAGVITVTDDHPTLHFNQTVGTPNIDSQSVTTVKIADLNVTSGKISDGAVIGTKIANSAVSELKIAASAVTNSRLANNAVTNEKILDLTISGNKIVADSIDDTKVGNRVAQAYRRQGGHANNWHVFGTTNYALGAVRMQFGAAALGPLIAGYKRITFPVAFSATPVVFFTHYWDGTHNSPGAEFIVIEITATYFDFDYVLPDAPPGGSSSTAFWMAVGTE